MTIDRERLRELHNYETSGERTAQLFAAAALDSRNLLKLMSWYAAWNGLFGSGVASLSGKIGRTRALFQEDGFPAVVADRSVLVASYFFDAARDEFDDRDTAHRDTHRCLAQATLLGMLDWAREMPEGWSLTDADLAAFFAEPMWLTGLRHRVTVGYGGGTSDEATAIFRAIGYHVGSELLADQEFSKLDATLRGQLPELVRQLKEKRVTIAGQPHDAYQWVGIHSGHGGGAEADHFEWAVQGARRAFEFTPAALHGALRHQLEEGYLDFVRDHEEFFARAAEALELTA